MEIDEAALEAVAREVSACRACARLVAWRESAPAQSRRQAEPDAYWARGVPGFGDPGARLVLVGLAPAAHGANRTGRMFTGDRSGDFLFAALHRAGFATQPESRALDDGLTLRDAYLTAAVRCAPPDNRPLPEERARCAPFLGRELVALGAAQVLLALGAFAYEALRRDDHLRPAAAARWPRFAHGAAVPALLGERPMTVLCSYHPSQRNVFTKLLTASMLDAVLGDARRRIDGRRGRGRPSESA